MPLNDAAIVEKHNSRAWKASTGVDLRSKWRIGISVAQYLIYSYLKAERDVEGVRPLLTTQQLASSTQQVRTSSRNSAYCVS